LIDVFGKCFGLPMRYYPNVYCPPVYTDLNKPKQLDTLEIGCFGAIRPMKNHAYQATAGLIAAIEIVDSRIIDWRIKIADTVADLASNGAIALSSTVIPIDECDPRLIGMVFTKNGNLVATGAGAAALGDPLSAVAWLANTLAPLGVTLPAGSVIMTGALHAMCPIAPGDTFRAEFSHLGPITLRISE
jgi:2-keto-4-pentenoate hydratase